MAIIDQLKTLNEIITAHYRAVGDGHPEVAAQFAVEGIIAMYKTQPQHLEGLLNYEIEDWLKLAKITAATEHTSK
jgi:hypothetical protein